VKKNQAFALFNGWLALAAPAFAQTSAAATFPGSSAHTASPARPSSPTDEIILLNPFDVTAGSTKGYMATNTISGTAMNTPLKEVPMTINVITSELLADMAVGDLAQAFTFNSSITQTSRQPASNRGSILSIRGFRGRNVLIDGVTGGDFIPTQMIDRIEVVKGPNTLYGQSDPGGLVNIITKRPQGRDRLNVSLRGGNHGLFGAEFDANKKALDGRLGVRVFGAHTATDGPRVVDGRKTDFLGLASDYRLTQNTTLVLHGSASKSEGVPSQRSNFSYQIIPTDLNRDGVIDNTVVNGVTESTARFNNTFLPRNYTSSTKGTHFTQENRFAQLGVRHAFNSHVNVQYMFVRTTQELSDTFREYNTFNAAGVADANHSADYQFNRTDAHTINGLLTFSTGPLAHRILAGGRYTGDLSRSSTYALRTLGPGAERSILEGMIAQGRAIRLFLTKNDVLSGMKFWLDDVPTLDELRTRGTRTSSTDYGETRVGSVYATDSVSVFSNRLKVLGGVRYIRIRGQSTNLEGNKIGVLSDKSKASYQAGSVFDLTSRVAVFANTATAFNPNAFDTNNGVFFDPELSRAYEGGFKFDDLWAGRLGGSLAVFHISKKNVLRSDYSPVLFRSVSEISDDESKGWEAEVFFNPTKAWQTVLNYTRIDAKVVVSRTTAKNLRLEGAAPHRLTFWSSYGINEGPLQGLRFGGGVIVASGPIQQFGTSSNQFMIENGYTVINLFARYGMKIAKRAVTFGANVDNLNDTFFMRSAGGASDPRQITFSASLDL
jgi:iron complex outermembrane recepter protein